MNYTNLAIGEKFQNFVELYNMIELPFLENEILIGYTSAQFHHSNKFLLLFTVALDVKF